MSSDHKHIFNSIPIGCAVCHTEKATAIYIDETRAAALLTARDNIAAGHAESCNVKAPCSCELAWQTLEQMCIDVGVSE